MNKLLLIAGVFLLQFSKAYGQCGATNVDATPLGQGICEGSSANVSFFSNGSCIGGAYQYQVSLGATIIQAWSTTASITVSPSTTSTYTIQSRCSACPTVVVSDTFLVEVIEQPTVTGLTSVCTGTSTTLTATSTNSTLTWWSTLAGGTQLSANGTLTTPNLSANTTYYVQATGTINSGSGQGSILITECGLQGFAPGADNDYVEISNLFSTPVNTAGWKVAVSNSYTNINSVNATVWNLPASFTSCSILSKTDVTGTANYWGSNILWNPNNSGWAIIIDNLGNVVDFVGWGWTAAQLASFNTTIAGFPITLGSEWTGASCSNACTVVGGNPYSISRNGSNDNNNAGDFVCQATSLNLLNPGLNCGWASNSLTCPYPTSVIVDQAPTATNPNPVVVECIGDVPIANVAVVDDEADDFTLPPTVTYVGEVSNGLTCPEILTRTYQVSDVCNNTISVTQTITIDDITAPVMDPEPVDVNVQCTADIPPMVNLNWTDNCDGAGVVTGTDVSNGSTCPEIITRTWTYSDACGNTATRSQIITIHDTEYPVLEAAPADLNVQCYTDVPSMAGINWTDNCAGAGTITGVEVSSGTTCPEVLTRTWTYTDDCGNTSTETQTITIHDTEAPVLAAAPANLAVQCSNDVPAMVGINWSDNCDGSGVLTGNEVSDGNSCPELITRTWSYTDACGNTTTVSQTITVNDTQAPTASNLPTIQVDVLPASNPAVVSDAADNCGMPLVQFVSDVSNNGFCPEIVTRTYSVTDDCGNSINVTQQFIVGDPFPEVSFTASQTNFSNLDEAEVEFFNHSTGAVSYIWNFGDGSANSDLFEPTHIFPNEETAGYVVELIGISEFGCMDTFNMIISIKEELVVYIPNTFTPDDNEFNQTFQPVFTSGFDPFNFHMYIYNRWGELLFESFDAAVGWDGTYQGELVQAGTYVWTIWFMREDSSDKEVMTGHISIMR